jgi:NAD(P)-dependent dehydrogenase (short-subunit alcohol dehydrogenase family)
MAATPAPHIGNELAGKAALVTGGGGRIGDGQRQYLGRGPQKNCGDDQAGGGKAAFHVADITKPDQVKRLVVDTAAPMAARMWSP